MVPRALPCPRPDVMKEVECPACGALIEEPDEEQLVEGARLHSREAHGYDLPAEHVLKAARNIPERSRPPAVTT
ncbi:MAG: hypothetical protein NVS3B24_01850 [Candidatus Dormibacteria bacterium]